MNEFLDYIQSLNPNYELEGIKKAYELAAETVSYTHLDVYKRQELSGSALRPAETAFYFCPASPLLLF